MDDSNIKPAQSEGRRQRRIARRRKRILEAAAQVFAQQGYAATTTREIAQAADIAEGTLYNYFGGKREILVAVVEEAEPPMITALAEAGSFGDRETMIRMFEQALEVSENQLPFAQALLSEAWVDDSILQDFVIARYKQAHQLLESYISERVAAGVFRAINPSMGANLILAFFGGLILPTLRGAVPPPSAETRRHLAEIVVNLLLDGILVRN